MFSETASLHVQPIRIKLLDILCSTAIWTIPKLRLTWRTPSASILLFKTVVYHVSCLAFNRYLNRAIPRRTFCLCSCSVCVLGLWALMVDNTRKASICHLQPLSGTCMHYVPSMLLNDIVNMLAWKCAWPCRKLTTNSSCLWARSRLRFYRKWLYPFPSNA
ncbi:hypothetical protein EV361DRAFT_580336 [Lentinula raphanica]|nr:hypothetical protein FB446DRAFT_736802 [Lentinula raphanica]KAJ3966308.1 hypothetical protein EV361DRAFT_580336 [Lentinula raphanica]